MIITPKASTSIFSAISGWILPRQQRRHLRGLQRDFWRDFDLPSAAQNLRGFLARFLAGFCPASSGAICAVSSPVLVNGFRDFQKRCQRRNLRASPPSDLRWRTASVQELTFVALLT